MQKIWRWLIRDRWTVRRCGWPYAEGFATYNRHRRMVLDTGLTREEAEAACNELNR
jgi:hypothetical protein